MFRLVVARTVGNDLRREVAQRNVLRAFVGLTDHPSPAVFNVVLGPDSRRLPVADLLLEGLPSALRVVFAARAQLAVVPYRDAALERVIVSVCMTWRMKRAVAQLKYRAPSAALRL